MTSGQFRYDPQSTGADVRRAAASAAVQGVYRLVKACLLHSDSNQAIVALIPAAAAAVADFCEIAGVPSVSLVFAEEGIFANGQVLRTSREGYDTARELGALLHACGVNELVIEKGVRPTELAIFARLLADAQRDRAAAERLTRSELRGVRARSVPSPADAAGGAAPAQELPLLTRSIRAYAASLLVMRAVHAELRAGDEAPLDRVRRVAQKLVSLLEEDARPLLTLAVSIEADSDDATLAVATAVVSLAVARQLTPERRPLSALATAALLYDAGRRRLLRAPGPRPEPPPPSGQPPASTRADRGAPSTLSPPGLDRALDREEQARLPASAAVALTTLGKLHAPSMARTVILHEALALRPDAPPRRAPARPAAATPAASPRPPTMLARILAVARAFTELRSMPVLGAGSASRVPLDEVMQRLVEHTAPARPGAPAAPWGATERTLIKLLSGALGFLPAGAAAEPTAGEVPVVSFGPDSRAPASRGPDSRGSSQIAAVRPTSPQGPTTRSSSPKIPAVRSSASSNPRMPAVQPPASVQPGVAQPGVAQPGAAQPGAAQPGLAQPGLAQPSGPSSAQSPLRPAERVRTAPAHEGRAPHISQPVAAAWLGRPLTPPGGASAAEPPRSARRPPPVDREALREKLRRDHLASTQPPPPADFEAPIVPRPPRLPAESGRPAASAARPASAQPPVSFRPRRVDPRTDPIDEDTWTEYPTAEPPAGAPTVAPPSAHPTEAPPPAHSTLDPPAASSTLQPPPPPPTLRGSHLTEVPSAEPTLPGGYGHESGEEWPDLDDLPNLDVPPVVASPPSSQVSREEWAPRSSSRADPRMEPDDDGPSSEDERPTAGPPAVLPISARDRLLAEYLAEIGAGVPPAPPSSRGPSRPPIPREEPPPRSSR